jgi:hypothetical protein
MPEDWRTLCCTDNQSLTPYFRFKTEFPVYFYKAVELKNLFRLPRKLLTPMMTMYPAICCKIVSCLDPWVYAISHPRYRMELERRWPWMGITEKPETKGGDDKSQGTTAESTT